MKKVLLLFFLIAIIVIFLLRNNALKPKYKKISKKESCINCHTEKKTGFSKYHLPENIGCASCHLGNIFSNNKDSAHINMVKIPGNLNTADKTCGKCHSNQVHNVKKSLMTTNSGLIAVDKYFFKDSDSLNAYYHIKNLGFDASDTHLRNLCASCHLGSEKKEFGAITEKSRGGGCNACHLNYIKGKNHASTSIEISNTHCFGCHSRSSRISTNYMGYSETQKKHLPNDGNHKQFEDGRIYKFNESDIHHKAGLLCIDCHSAKEVMGHGVEYAHQEDAVKIQCKDCHNKKYTNTLKYSELDSEDKMLFFLREFKHNDKKIIKTQKSGFALINTYINSNNEAILISKKDKKEFKIPKPTDACTKNKHKNLNCNTCHSSWTSKCISCHNTYNNDDFLNGYDLLAKKAIDESWNEIFSDFKVSAPAFGVRYKNGIKEIQTAIPGMIMTINHQSFDSLSSLKESFYRLYAPTSPHTTTKNIRPCESCHSNPYALGYGTGNLKFLNNQWIFTAHYKNNPNDDLPEDAWIGMFEEIDEKKDYSTRTNFRPFNIQEQKAILEVGKCLKCHNGKSAVMQDALDVGIFELNCLFNK